MSANTNILVIEGRLTRDPTITKIQKGTSLCKFSIANNRYYYTDKGFKNEVSFFNVVVWGYLADKASMHLRKGRHVLLEGQIRQDSYTSKLGEKKQNIYILASDIQYLDKKNKSEDSSTKAYALSDIVKDFKKDSIEESLCVEF